EFEASREACEPAQPEGDGLCRVGEAPRTRRIGDRLAEGPDGQVRALREKERPRSRRQLHPPVSERPDAGNGPEDRALPDARGAGEERVTPGSQLDAVRGDQRPAVREVEGD